jgi:hypothetical protein
MKLFIWENDGISDAYHDDGTLVVLAETAEQAREIARAEKAAEQAEEDRLAARRPQPTRRFIVWDGSEGALDREPDRIVDVADGPAVVAFNGGGYD